MATTPHTGLVISYTRFSSSRQSKGDSYRRQTQTAAEWCAKQTPPATLDEKYNFNDKGKSGFTGAHLKKGSELYRLVEFAEEGELGQGDIVLIESLDRLSRLPLMEAFALIWTLTKRGMRIITLQDEREYNDRTLTRLEDFLTATMIIARSHNESSTKSARLRETFTQHRTTGSKKAFGSAPGWLSRKTKEAPWEVDPEKAASVSKVFAMAVQGYGSKLIAARANEEGWPSPMRLALTGARWHAQMPGTILRNRAVLGWHEHKDRTFEAQAEHWAGKSRGVIIKDYYPQIIDDHTWTLARSGIKLRFRATRKSSNYFNVFSGLVSCGRCGAPMQRKMETRGKSKGHLVCADHLVKLTDCPSTAINCFDGPVLAQIIFIASASLGGSATDTKSDELIVAKANLDGLDAKDEKLVALLAEDNPSPAARKLYDKNKLDRTALLLKVESLRLELAAATGTVFDDSVLAHYMNHLYGIDQRAQDVRAELSLKLARLVDRIWVWSYDCAVFRLRGNEQLYSVQLYSKSKPPMQKRGTRSAPMGPFYQLAIAGDLVPPTPRVPKHKEQPAN